MNTLNITPEQSEEILLKAMERMRWKLWFSFAESKYETFRKDGNPKKPNYKTINEYCKEHWGKYIGDLTKEELQEKIAIVNKWKEPKKE